MAWLTRGFDTENSNPDLQVPVIAAMAIRIRASDRSTREDSLT
jgi:hypothetical protein